MEKRGTDSSKVKNDLELKILRGYYGESGQVPTTKKIAEDYGVGLTTASTVLRTLVAEGVLCSAQGKGYYVVPYCKAMLIKKHINNLNNQMEELYDYAQMLNIDFADIALKICDKKTN